MALNLFKKNSGFTLIELLIVVAIIGILAAVGAAVIPGLLENARVKAIKAQHIIIRDYISAEIIKCELGASKIFLDQNGIGETCPVKSAANSSPESYIANALHQSMKNIYGKTYSGDPGAPSSWPVSAFYNSNMHQVVNCKKASPGCHVFSIFSNKPNTITIRTYLKNEILREEIDFNN